MTIYTTAVRRVMSSAVFGVITEPSLSRSCITRFGPGRGSYADDRPREAVLLRKAAGAAYGIPAGRLVLPVGVVTPPASIGDLRPVREKSRDHPCVCRWEPGLMGAPGWPTLW
jgi:hypothetical protein